jgi:hypothetical protein
METGCVGEHPELSVEAEMELASLVAESCGVDASVALFALRDNEMNVDAAINVLIHGQCEDPTPFAAIAFSDAVRSVADCCGVDVEIAAAAMKANNNDFDHTVHQLVYGLWDPAATPAVEELHEELDEGVNTSTSEVKKV